MGGEGTQDRLSHSFRQSSSSFGFPKTLWELFSQLGERQSPVRRDAHSTAEGGRGTCFFQPRVLQPGLCSAQGFRRFPPSDRFVLPESLCLQDKVPDGNQHFSSFLNPHWRLDAVCRSPGCIFSDSSSSGKQEVSSLRVAGPSLPVHGSLLRVVNGSPGLYQSDGSSFSGFTQEGDSPAALPRRLAPPGNFQTGGIEVEGRAPGSMQTSQHSYQLGKIQPGTKTGCDVSGDGDTLNDFEGFPIAEARLELAGRDQGLHQSCTPTSAGLVDIAWPSLVPDSPCPWGPSQDAQSPVPAVHPLGQTEVTQILSSPTVTGGVEGPSVVVQHRKSSSWSVATVRGSGDVPLRGRFSRWLGRFHSREGGERLLVTSRATGAHHPPRAEGDTTRSSVFRGRSPGEDSCRSVGQHHCHLILKEGWRDEVSHSQPRGSGDSAVGGGQLSHHPYTVRQGGDQRRGGLPQQEESGRLHRVGPPSSGMQPSVETLGQPSRGPVCHSAEPQTPQFCVTISRSDGGGNGCLSVSLGPQGAVRVSPFPRHQESDQQTLQFRRGQAHPGSPLLAPAGMVSGSGGIVHPDPKAAAPEEGPSASAPLPQVPPQSPRASASRVETVKRLLRFRGYSGGVSTAVAESRRNSTIVNYQHKWKRFRQWCHSSGHSASRPSSQKFASFLLYLHDRCHMSVSTIKGYKAMLNSVFALKGFNLTDDPVLENLIKSFEVQAPRRVIRPPSWNLDVVLKALTLAPFEPLRSTSFRNLTKKTLFLVSLATAKRVGELQALSRTVVQQGGDLLVSYLPEFVAKTETASNPLPREFRIKSLAAIVGHGDEERLLCPVRALNTLRERTRGVTPKPRHLFVSPSNTSRPLSKNALSYLLRETILHAHQSLHEDHMPPLRVRAHDIRGIATSLNLWKNRSVASVLEAASWKTPSVFVDHYLKDMERSDGATSSLGPLVAAGSFVH